MHNLVLSPIDPEILINRIAEKVAAKIQESTPEPTDENPQNPMDDYIQKKDVVGKLASGSTLWKYEREGKLPVYGVGGKRFYRRADIENLFKRINH